MVDIRKRRLQELLTAHQNLERLKTNNSNVQSDDPRFVQAEEHLKQCKLAFKDSDRTVFEWLHIIEDYKGDIYDSTVQTLKFLEYDFLAAGANAMSRVLPPRMEFRPMIEMTPDHLEPQVEAELKDLGSDEDDTDATLKILDKWSKDSDLNEIVEEPPMVEPDILSLSLLMAQDIDESTARRALGYHNNNMQEALEWIFEGCPSLAKPKPEPVLPPPSEGDVTHAGGEGCVRLPSTLKRVEKMRERRRNEREARLRSREDARLAQVEAERKELERRERRMLRKEQKLAAKLQQQLQISSSQQPSHVTTSFNKSSSLLDMSDDEDYDNTIDHNLKSAQRGDVAAALKVDQLSRQHLNNNNSINNNFNLLNLDAPTPSNKQGENQTSNPFSAPRAFGEVQGSSNVDLLTILQPLPASSLSPFAPEHQNLTKPFTKSPPPPPPSAGVQRTQALNDIFGPAVASPPVPVASPSRPSPPPELSDLMPGFSSPSPPRQAPSLSKSNDIDLLGLGSVVSKGQEQNKSSNNNKNNDSSRKGGDDDPFALLGF